MTRKPLVWVLLAVLAVGIGSGLYWFAPWRLFTDTTVREALTTPGATGAADQNEAAANGAASNGAAPSAVAVPVVVASGSFVSHEHATSGTVRLVRAADGRRVLRSRAWTPPTARTSRCGSPTRRSWTDPGWPVFDDGRTSTSASLKGNKGDQVYPIPASADLAALRSVTIWCKRFSVSFGAARLA